MPSVLALLALLVACALVPGTTAKSAKKIACYEGDKEINVLSHHVYDYCEGYYSFSKKTVILIGKNGDHPNRRFMEDGTFMKRTHGCHMELDEDNQFAARCTCFKSKCNAALDGKELMKSALNFVKLSDEFLHADDDSDSVDKE